MRVVVMDYIEDPGDPAKEDLSDTSAYPPLAFCESQHIV